MKILIIGAGPIGCYTARLLKENNDSLDLKIIEEHPEVGKPVHCAGLVSTDVLAQLRVSIDNNVIINYIHGAEFFLNDNNFKINRKDVALVFDRESFDRTLGDSLNIDFNTRFMGIEKNGNGFLVETDKGEYYADIVIGADGANSSVRKIAGFKEDIEYLRGVQFRIRYNKCNKNIVQVYLKKPFFAWVIPESEEIVRVGIISNNPYHDLIEFLREIGFKGETLEKFAGVVPLGQCKTQDGNLVLVGDAACQVKPLTHGGIYYGMRCAEILVDCILQNRLFDYERQWRQRFEREIQIGLKIRQIYQQLSNENIEKIFNLLKENVDILEQFGDFENHSKVISVFINTPRLYSFLGKLLINIVQDIKL